MASKSKEALFELYNKAKGSELASSEYLDKLDKLYDIIYDDLIAMEILKEKTYLYETKDKDYFSETYSHINEKEAQVLAKAGLKIERDK